jgi:hypothetical protein
MHEPSTAIAFLREPLSHKKESREKEYQQYRPLKDDKRAKPRESSYDTTHGTTHN